VVERLVDSLRAEPEAEVDREPEVLRGAGVMVVVVVVVLEATEAFEEVTQVRLSMAGQLHPQKVVSDVGRNVTQLVARTLLPEQKEPVSKPHYNDCRRKKLAGPLLRFSLKRSCVSLHQHPVFFFLSFGMRYDA
jgi:hypothetical protein